MSECCTLSSSIRLQFHSTALPCQEEWDVTREWISRQNRTACVHTEILKVAVNSENRMFTLGEVPVAPRKETDETREAV